MISNQNPDQSKDSEPKFLPINTEIYAIVNCEFIRSEVLNYPHKITEYGEVIYSPRYVDERYTYRHVILTREVRREAEKLASRNPSGLLSEKQIIHDLGIDLTPGWEHFMKFKGRLRELILRRPLVENAKVPVLPLKTSQIFNRRKSLMHLK